jgi:ATP dependent DNA ligase domain
VLRGLPSNILIPVPLPPFQPMPLSRARAPFSHPHWIFEIKWDGFRALLYPDKDGVRLISRNGNTFKSFPGLCEGLARDLNGRRCVLDGEIVCLDSHGMPQFRDLLFRRTEPLFYAFDMLWDEHAKSDDEEEMRRFRNGEDLRYLPLIDRKLRLHAVVPKQGERLLYCDHIPRWRRTVPACLPPRPRRNCGETQVRSVSARARAVAQDSEPEILPVGRTRGAIRARARRRSRLPSLGRICSGVRRNGEFRPG